MMATNTISSLHFNNLSDFLMYFEKTIVFRLFLVKTSYKSVPELNFFQVCFHLLFASTALPFYIIHSFYVYSIITNKNTFNQDLIIVFLICQNTSFFFGLIDGEQYLNSDSLLLCLYKKFKDFTFTKDVKPNPNRIHKLVLPVIIFQSRTGTEPEKIKFAKPKPEPKLYFKRFRFDIPILIFDLFMYRSR